MKKIVGISLFIFWAAVTAVLVTVLLFYQNNNNEKSNSSSIANSLFPENNIAQITLNSQEIARHNNISDCWVIIDSKVYNFTSYLSKHPGGAASMIPYCGKDATQAFLGLPHSSYANSLLANYFIGNLNQATETQQLQQNIQDTSAIAPPANSKRDDDKNEKEDDD
jgi:cytochrome b involved in lipid metabolism